jgi:DNA-binding CsgD family transcriptional regulator
MAGSLRKTGLSILGDMPWGSHFSLFYQTKQDLLDAIVPFLKAGLDSNELCLWVISKDQPLTIEEASCAIPRTRNLEILSHEEWFGDPFDFPRVVGLVKDKLGQALAKGCAGLRLNGSSAWLQKEQWEHFQAFEGTLDGSLADEPLLVLCNFQLATINASEFIDAASAHHFTLVRRNGVWQTILLGDPPTRVHSLTPRELDVLTWVARGKTASEIGEILGITKRTVDEHVQTAVRKLGAANRTQAVVRALVHKIIEV